MRRSLQLGLVLVPAVIGLALNLILVGIFAPDQPPLITSWIPLLILPEGLNLRIDWGSLVLLAGLFTSILMSAGLILKIRLDREREHEIAHIQVRTQAQAIRDRHRFLQRLDHELKNPLTAIRVGLANLDNGADPGTQRETLSTVNAQVHRISRLTADLRKLAELDTRPIERSPLNMASLLQQVFDLAHERDEAEHRRLSLILPQAPWPLPIISGDRDLLLLVIHNLIDNAIKFTRPGDTIEIRAFEDSAAVVVEVADTGPGITPEDMPHVWEELYRGQGARGVQGSGLGLALAHMIVQRHEGHITLRSRPGQGTVFTVRLPIKN